MYPYFKSQSLIVEIKLNVTYPSSVLALNFKLTLHENISRQSMDIRTRNFLECTQNFLLENTANKMYLARVFTILLVLIVSSQYVLKLEVFDDITQKCQNAVSDHTVEIEDYNIKLEQKWQDKIIKDVNNT